MSIVCFLGFLLRGFMLGALLWSICRLCYLRFCICFVCVFVCVFVYVFVYVCVFVCVLLEPLSRRRATGRN